MLSNHTIQNIPNIMYCNILPYTQWMIIVCVDKIFIVLCTHIIMRCVRLFVRFQYGHLKSGLHSVTEDSVLGGPVC